MSMGSDFIADHAFEIYNEGMNPNELYWKKILGFCKKDKPKDIKRTDGFFSVKDHLKTKEDKNGSV